jgi:hypothetical protein
LLRRLRKYFLRRFRIPVYDQSEIERSLDEQATTLVLALLCLGVMASKGGTSAPGRQSGTDRLTPPSSLGAANSPCGRFRDNCLNRFFLSDVFRIINHAT